MGNQLTNAFVKEAEHSYAIEINMTAMGFAVELIKSGVRISDDPVELAERLKTFLMTVDKNSQEV